MSDITDTYTSIGCLKNGATGISISSAFYHEGMPYWFNEAFTQRDAAKIGWYKNRNGIYAGCSYSSDIELFDQNSADGWWRTQQFILAEGYNGGPAFTPKCIAAPEGSGTDYLLFRLRKYFTGTTFVGNRIRMRFIAKFPLSYQKASDDDTTDRLYFNLNTDSGDLSASIVLSVYNNIGSLCAYNAGNIHRQHGLIFLDGQWHTVDLLLKKNFPAELFLDGQSISPTSESFPYSGSLSSPSLNFGVFTHPNTTFVVQSFSVEVYDEV